MNHKSKLCTVPTLITKIFVSDVMLLLVEIYGLHGNGKGEINRFHPRNIRHSLTGQLASISVEISVCSLKFVFMKLDFLRDLKVTTILLLV